MLFFMSMLGSLHPKSRGSSALTRSYSTNALHNKHTPPVGFTYVTNGGCAPVTVQFYSQFNGPSYAWTFGDGGTSPDCNPLHTYTTPGTYTVTLVATGGTYTSTIVVGAVPVVTFAGDANACQFSTKPYSVTSTLPAASYSWSADGGVVSGSTTSSANVTWNTYGVNYVHYTITTASGCTKIFSYKVLVVPEPEFNLPCCQKGRDKDLLNLQKERPDPKEGVPGGDEPCYVCAGSYNCYGVYLNTNYSSADDYYWFWSVTNGTISSISGDSTEACVTWGTSGTAKITLTMINKKYGCVTTKTCELIINPGITPALSATGSCVNSPVSFDASATSPINSVTGYDWDFGDSYTASSVTPFTSHVYNTVGVYKVTLTIHTSEGCDYVIAKNVNIINGTRPVIVCPGTVCEGTRSCYSTTAISGATYTWSVSGDDPSQRTVDNNKICVTWGTGPVGTVTVTVDNGGYTCTKTVTEAVAIVSKNILIDADEFVCDNEYTVATVANYTGACYYWYVNGTAQASTTNTMYYNTGMYSNPIKIEVKVDFGLGCCHGYGVKEVKKLPQYTMVNYNNQECIGNTQIYYLVFPGGLPANAVSWSVEGGVVVASDPSWVKVTWNTVGSGSITASNNSPNEYCNDGGNSTWNINVWDKATGDDITGPQLVCGGTTQTYYHGWTNPTSGVTVSVSPAGPAVSAGTYSSSIYFPPVGSPTTYTVSVTYNHSYVSGCGTTKTYTVTSIPNTIPTFVIPPGNVCEGDIITYNCSMSDPSFYKWDVVGGVILSENFSAGTLGLQIQWNSTVNSSITLTNKACGNSNTQTIIVNGRPKVIISKSDPTCTTTGITLSVAPVWNSYSWSNGATGVNSIVVTSIGTYSITVGNGVCYKTESATVSAVTATPPVINSFSITPPLFNWCPKYNKICPNITVGTAPIVAYNWTFSGFTITSSTVQCPAVALSSNPGTGSWTLTVTDAAGCTASLSGSLSDACTPYTGTGGCTHVATFSTVYDPCTGQFNSTGTNVSSVYWDFGDGVQGSGISPVHAYSTACNKNVVAYVADINNCVQAYYFTIAVPYTFGNLNVSVSNNSCSGASALTANGLAICPGSGVLASYDWIITPAGGGAAYSPHPTSNPVNVSSLSGLAAGNYNVQVNVTAGSCTKTAYSSFNKGGLQAYFANCGGCSGSPITFTDQSVPYSAPIIKWEWTFTGPGGVITSYLQNPTVTLINTGGSPVVYTVTLKVTDNLTCTATHTVLVTVNPAFNPGAIVVKKNGSAVSGTAFNICRGENYTLTAPAGASYMWSNGEITQTINVTEPGAYTVTVFNNLNCAAKVGPVTFNFKPSPEAIIVEPASLCTPAVLRAFAGTGYTYNWTYPISLTSTSPLISVYNSGLVTLKVTNLHGCSSTASKNYVVKPSPNVYINPSPVVYCPGVPNTLTAVAGGGTTPYTYAWSNGTTGTNAIIVNNPGTYSVTVTGANSCPAKASITLTPRLPDGMDKLPYGCYDVCGPVSFCDGTVPYGWTGQWYNGNSPYGSPVPTYGSIATTFNASGTYTFHYIPVDAYHCAAVSKPISINIVSMPTITVTSNPQSPVICKGSGQTITLTASPQDATFSYTWYLGGVVVGTGYTYNASQAGVYQVVVAKSECCSVSAQFEVYEGDCCFENPDVQFTPILSDITISTNEFWHDKYFIDATVTVNGSAELDITNVDCVFGPKGRIVFTEKSFLRCNNSVLRPCKKEDIWQGLSFDQGASGWINTTTIKNAIIGVDIVGNERGVRMTDNSFIKCNTSVRILKSINQQSISGNTFEIDETELPYANPNEYWGIRMEGVYFDGLISQNQFRNVKPAYYKHQFYGIYANYAHFTASENNFNDMFRAADITQNWDVVAFEKNTIKLNNMDENYDKFQLRVSNCENPVLIYQNEFNNSYVGKTYAGAIYVEGTRRTHVKDNKIDGFRISVLGYGTNSLHLNTNTITNSIGVGIELIKTGGTIVSCNSINSMSNGNSTLFGTGLYGIISYYDEYGLSVYSNCIFNSTTAVAFYAPYLGAPMPEFYNNFLYNYTENGLLNMDYSGNIGNPGSPTDAGRNTFMSNNTSAGSTLDINSTIFIGEAGNFGVLSTNNVGSMTGMDEFYSTAACSHQISNTYPKNQLDRFNICDLYYLDKWIKKDDFGMYELIRTNNDLNAEKINAMVEAKSDEVLGMITEQMQQATPKAINTISAVLSSKMDKDIAARILVNNLLATQNYETAKQVLNDARLASMNDVLRKVLVAYIESSSANTSILPADVATMEMLQNSADVYRRLAREILQSGIGLHDYLFENIELPKTPVAKNIVQRENPFIKVYPVPATSIVNVNYAIKDAKVTGIKILNSAGQEVKNFSYKMQAGTVTVDVSGFSSSMYSIVLITDHKTKATTSGKFIKL